MTTNSALVGTSPASVRTLAWRYGGLGFGLMLLYFLLINTLGQQGSALARFGSHAFTVLAVVLAIRSYKGQSRGPAPYLGGLGLSFLVALISSGLFAGFILLYANVLHPSYQQALNRQTYFDAALGTGVLAASIVLLGVVVGSLTGYTLMMANGTDAQATSAESQGA